MWAAAAASSNKSVSKCDITNLEKKIKVLEKQIEGVKDKHVIA